MRRYLLPVSVTKSHSFLPFLDGNKVTGNAATYLRSVSERASMIAERILERVNMLRLAPYSMYLCIYASGWTTIGKNGSTRATSEKLTLTVAAAAADLPYALFLRFRMQFDSDTNTNPCRDFVGRVICISHCSFRSIFMRSDLEQACFRKFLPSRSGLLFSCLLDWQRIVY